MEVVHMSFSSRVLNRDTTHPFSIDCTRIEEKNRGPTGYSGVADCPRFFRERNTKRDESTAADDNDADD